VVTDHALDAHRAFMLTATDLTHRDYGLARNGLVEWEAYLRIASARVLSGASGK
jgi:hypothetical protein